MNRRAARALAALLAAPSTCAVAGRPMVTDDARLAEPKACQVESWMRRTHDATELWALPACNPTGDLELTFGAARTRADGATRFSDNIVQAKTLLRPLTEDEWGLGLVAGTVRHAARENANGWPGDPYMNVALSVTVMRDAQWVAHFNTGAVRLRDTGRTLGTWAFGNEVRVRHDVVLIPEVFRSGFGRPFFQAGLRYDVVRDRMNVNAAYGDRVGAGAGERWFSLGVSLYSPAFLP